MTQNDAHEKLVKFTLELGFIQVLHYGKLVFFVWNLVPLIINLCTLFTDTPNFALTKNRPQNQS